jgi:hypothetical protein
VKDEDYMIHYRPWNIIVSYTLTSERPKPGDTSAKKYEERVRLVLNAIGRTHTGTALFKSLFASAPLWIFPYSGLHGYCNAITSPFYSKHIPSGAPEYEGVKINYSPDVFALDDCGWYPGSRPEEVLFHEMVHASRSLNNPVFNNDPLYLMQDFEEFLAVLVTNMYRTELGARKLHRDYVYKELVSQPEAEAFLSSRREYIDALEWFLEERLVKLLVPLNTPFNPFRDFQRLKANHNGIQEVLDSINVAGKLREMRRIRKLGEKLQVLRTMSQEGSSRALSGK